MLIIDIKTGVRQKSHKLQLTAYGIAYGKYSGVIIFDPDTHVYMVDGVEIPSVTTILKETGLIDDKWFKEGCAERGTDVHEYLELFDKGLKVAVPLQYTGFLNAYRDFQNDTNLTVMDIECGVYDPDLRVCGKIDRVFDDGKKRTKIGSLHLSSDGKYKFREYKILKKVWESCVTVYNFKHGR